MTDLRQAAQQALEALDCPGKAKTDDEQAAITALRAALAEPEQEPVATKQMLRWVEHLKRLSDDGQHMSIPGLSSGACWELAIELEQFIKNTAPTPRKPLTDEEIVRLMVGEDRVQLLYSKPGDPYFSEFAEGAIRELVESGRAIERAHGIGAQHGS